MDVELQILKHLARDAHPTVLLRGIVVLMVDRLLATIIPCCINKTTNLSMPLVVLRNF
jgi:hypothetical protein